MTDLLTLAEACEKASGPNFQLEQEIGAAVFPKRADPYPAYTASLDAAMTLVPEGWWVQHVGYCLNGWRARVECNTGHRETLSVGVGFGCEAPIRSAALALCAAALRAREVTHEPR